MEGEDMANVVIGDCRETMRAMDDASVDSVVCDPPYELGFMGKRWDSTGVAYDVEVWREALRVLKPGGHLLAFSGSRTYHRMAVAIEDAGFEIRDQLMWIYGSGFPKSLDVSKAIDKAAGAEREVVGISARSAKISRAPRAMNPGGGNRNVEDAGVITAPATPEAARHAGWGTALKPAHEPICMARKPLVGTVAANVLAFGTGGINVDGCRVETGESLARPYGGDNEVYGEYSMVRGTITGQDVSGRFPANVLHDGSAEVVVLFPQTKSPAGMSYRSAGDNIAMSGGNTERGMSLNGHGDSGSAARFFYSAKASRSDREAGLAVEALEAAAGRVNVHPTVKPTDVMHWLVRLVTPVGGLVLDPFTGSGSTGRAAVLEGMRFVGCELSPEYAAIAERRIADAVEMKRRPERTWKAKPRKAVAAQGGLF